MSSGQVTLSRSSENDIRAEEREERDGNRDIAEGHEVSSSAGSSQSSKNSKDKKKEEIGDDQAKKENVKPQARCLLRKELRERYHQKGNQTFSLNLLLAHVVLDELAESDNEAGDWAELATYLEHVSKLLESTQSPLSATKRNTLESSLDRLRTRLDNLFQDPQIQSSKYKAGLSSDQAQALNVCNQLQHQLSQKGQRQHFSWTRPSSRFWSNVERCLSTSMEARSLETNLNTLCVGFEITSFREPGGEAFDPVSGSRALEHLDWDGVKDLTICGTEQTWYMCLSKLARLIQNVTQIHLHTHISSECKGPPFVLPVSFASLRSLKALRIDQSRFSWIRSAPYGHCTNILRMRKSVMSPNILHQNLPSLRSLCIIRLLRDVPVGSWRGLKFMHCPQHIRSLVKHTYICVSCQHVVSLAGNEAALMEVARYERACEGLGYKPLDERVVQVMAKLEAVLTEARVLPQLRDALQFNVKQQRYTREAMMSTEERRMSKEEYPTVEIGGRGHWLEEDPSHWVDWRFCHRCIRAHLRIDVAEHCRCIVCKSERQTDVVPGS